MRSFVPRLTFLTSLACSVFLSSESQAIFLWFEDFESIGQDRRFTLTGGDPYYTDAQNYLTRVQDVNAFLPGGISPPLDLDSESGQEYTGLSGQWFMAAENVGSPRVFEWSNINTAPHFRIVFDADFAAGSSDVTPAYDRDDFLAVLYSTDGGRSFLPGLVIRFDGKDGALANRPLAQVNTIAPSGRNGIDSLRDLGAQLAKGHIVPPDDPDPDPFAYIAPDEGQAAAGMTLSPKMQKIIFDLPDVRFVTIKLVFNMSGENTEIAFDNLTIHGTVAVHNHPPAVNNILQSIQEDEIVTFEESSFDEGFRDPDSDDTLQIIRFTGLPTSGTLFKRSGGEAITRIPTEIPRSEIGDLVYVPKSNFAGPTASFRWHASDGSAYGPTDAAYIFQITERSDPPLATRDVVDRLPGQELRIPVATLLANDRDPFDSPPDLPLRVTRVRMVGGSGAQVRLDGDTVIYSPNGVTGADTFAYSIEDARGGVHTSVLVSVKVLDPDNPPLSARTLAETKVTRENGNARVQAVRLPWRVYRIQAADGDSRQWFDLPLGRVVADDQGKVEFVDPGPLPKARIYRTVHP